MINNQELEVLVLGWLVLEYVVKDLMFKKLGIFCDITSLVSWTYRERTSTSFPGDRLIRLLVLQQEEIKASSRTPMIIAEKDDVMADIPSKAFKDNKQ